MSGKGAQQYRALQKRVESGEDLIWSAELYYHLAVLTGNGLDVSQERNRKTVLELVDKGLTFNERDTDLLSYKAWVLKKGGMPEEAIAMYKALLEKNPQSDVALRGIADIYYEGDLDYAKRPLGTLCLYDDESPWVAYKLSRTERKMLESREDE